MEATHTETNISYGFKAQRSYVNDDDDDEFRSQDSHIINLSPERIAIYGDSYWRLSMLKAINHAVISLSPSEVSSN